MLKFITSLFWESNEVLNTLFILTKLSLEWDLSRQRKKFNSNICYCLMVITKVTVIVCECLIKSFSWHRQLKKAKNMWQCNLFTFTYLCVQIHYIHTKIYIMYISICTGTYSKGEEFILFWFILKYYFRIFHIACLRKTFLQKGI